MSTMNCTYDDREGALVEYVYGEMPPVAKAAFSAHLDLCGVCRHEVGELRAARLDLEAWQPPVTMGVPRALASPGGRSWQDVPAWARMAAAVLVLGVASGAANLRVTYGSDGLTIRTGWMSPSQPAPVQAAAAAAVPAGVQAPWRGDLEGLERQLRAEIQSANAASAVAARAPAAAPDQAMIRQMRALIAENTRQQQSELALRIAELVRDVQGQRQADLAKIDRNLGLIQNNTGVEVMRQRQLLNSLAVRVSQRQ